MTIISPGIIIGDAVTGARSACYNVRQSCARARARSILPAYQSILSKIIDRRDNSKLTRPVPANQSKHQVTNQSSQAGHAFSLDYVIERVANIQGDIFVFNAPTDKVSSDFVLNHIRNCNHFSDNIWI